MNERWERHSHESTRTYFADCDSNLASNSWPLRSPGWFDYWPTGWWLAVKGAVRGQCGVCSWLLLSRLTYGSRKDLTCDTGSRICADSTGCQEALCIKLRGEIFQPVYSFPPKACTYKHPQHIHAAQTSARLTRASDAHAVRKSVFCHIWLHSALAWWMTQQESQPDSARQRLCLSFAPYIHKSVIIAPVLTVYIFIHLSALVSKGRGWLLRYSSSFLCLVEVFTDVTSVWVKKKLCLQVSSYVEKDCRGAIFHLTHFISSMQTSPASPIQSAESSVTCCRPVIFDSSV